MLGFLRRTMHRCPQDLKEKAYMSTVRPKLEYCASIWDPYQQKYIQQLEMVQRRAARFVKNVPHKFSGSQPSVSAMMEDLGWSTLQDRRQSSRITLLYKIVNNLVEVPSAYHPVPNSNSRASRGHSQQYRRHQTEVDAYKYSFLPRTIADWNNLPPEVVSADSLESLKMRLTTHQYWYYMNCVFKKKKKC